MEAFRNAELRFLRALVKRRETSSAHRALASLTSRSFRHDWSVSIFAIGSLCLLKVGYIFFWKLFTGYVVNRLFQTLVVGERPFCRDSRLQPSIKVPPRGAGVSALCIFAVICLSQTASLLEPPFGWMFFGCGMTLCASSRLLAMVHFPHQIGLSMVLGGMSALLPTIVQGKIPPISNNAKLMWALVASGIVILDLLSRAEQDACEVRDLNVKKTEYVRVLENLMSSSESFDTARKINKQDSLVQLLRTMERRKFEQDKPANSFM